MSWKPRSSRAPKRSKDSPVGTQPKPGRKPQPDTVAQRAKSQQPQLTSAKRPQRNAPCPCGSGKKFKKCHGAPPPPPAPPPETGATAETTEEAEA